MENAVKMRLITMTATCYKEMINLHWYHTLTSSQITSYACHASSVIVTLLSLLGTRLCQIQMPFEDLLKDALAITLDYVSVAGDDALKVPLVDSGNRLCEAGSVARASTIPNGPLLPDGATLRALQGTKDLRQDS